MDVTKAVVEEGARLGNALNAYIMGIVALREKHRLLREAFVAVAQTAHAALDHHEPMETCPKPPCAATRDLLKATEP